MLVLLYHVSLGEEIEFGGQQMKQKVLSLLLGREGYISGEKISRELNISRTAVWKHVESLKQEGYTIDSVPRRGYKVLAAPDVLFPGDIKSSLETKVLGRDIHYFHSVDSTNRVAKELAEKGASEGTLVIAEEQTQGRGRMGRPWISPAGGIWMSLILRPHLPPYRVQGITLVASVAVVEAIKAVTGLRPLIKWPNDIYLEDKKVCGILTEMKGETDRVDYIVIGIGLNANNTFSGLKEEAPAAGALRGFLGRQTDRKELVRSILSFLEKAYLGYCREGIDPVLEQWRNNNFTLGRHVVLRMGGREFAGVAEDITAEGGLLLRDSQGSTRVFYSGEVTVTGHDGIDGKKQSGE